MMLNFLFGAIAVFLLIFRKPIIKRLTGSWGNYIIGGMWLFKGDEREKYAKMSLYVIIALLFSLAMLFPFSG